MTSLAKAVFISLRDHLRPLLAYHLLFTVLASALLLPAMGWALSSWLRNVGRPLVTTVDALNLLLTPAGLAWIYASMVAVLTLLYLQQAGMMLMAFDRRGSHAHQAMVAFRQTLHRLPALLSLAMIQVACHLAMIVVVLLCLDWLYQGMLGHLDAYYVRRVRPMEFWVFIASCLPIIGTWAALAGRQLLHWWLALPCLILEKLSAPAALKRSHALTHGNLSGMAAAVISMLAIILGLPWAISFAFGSMLSPLLAQLPENHSLVVSVMLIVVTLVTLITLAVAFAAIALNALLATCLYLDRAHSLPHLQPPPRDAHPGRLAWSVEAAAVIFALSQAWLMLESHEINDDVSVIAHRGSSWTAPENSLSAVRLAADEGADQVEVDVRLSADGVAVLSHDSSLRRLTGDERRIADLDWQTLARMDIGSSFNHTFMGEPLARLDQALAEVRGKAGLIIELKPSGGNEHQLLDAVMKALHAERDWRRRCRNRGEDFLARHICGNPAIFEDVWLATLSYHQLIQINRQAPEARTLLLAEWALPGGLPRHRFQALGLNHARIDTEEIERAHFAGNKLYAWTVNDQSRMARLIDMGVDGIITDRPDLLHHLLVERQRMGDGELLMLKLRHWLSS